MTYRSREEKQASFRYAVARGRLAFSELLKYFQHILYEDKSDLAIIIKGRKRTGKSTMGKRIMMSLDPDYSEARTVYDVEAFLEQWNLEPPPYSWIMYDDAANGLTADQWFEIEAKVFGKLMEMGGNRYYGIIITVNKLRRLTATARGQVNFIIEMDKARGRKGFAQVRLVDESKNLTRPFDMYPYFSFINHRNGYRFRPRTWIYSAPLPEDEYKEYDTDKTAAHREAYHEMQRKIAKSKEGPTKHERSPAQIAHFAEAQKKRWANKPRIEDAPKNESIDSENNI